MAVEVDVTGGVVRVKPNAGGTVDQPLDQAIDVSRIDLADLLLYIAGVEGAVGTPVVSLRTGMRADVEDGWVTVASFTSSTSPAFTEKKQFAGLLKYIRWQVTGFSTGTAFSFSLSGMGRNN